MPPRIPHSTLVRDTVLAHADGVDVESCGSFSLFVKYDESTSRAVISLRFFVSLEGFDRPESLTLVFHPENIIPERTILSSPTPLPPSVMNRLTGISNPSDIATLSLSLKSPGRIICPVSSQSLAPKSPCDPPFLTFFELCQATAIRIMLNLSRITTEKRNRLTNLIVSIGQLTSFPMDLGRKSRAYQEADWRALSLANPNPPVQPPPPYSCTSPVRATSKRARRASSSPITDEKPAAKRTLYSAFVDEAPPPSPTEKNTSSFSTESEVSPVRNIPPSKFVHRNPPAAPIFNPQPPQKSATPMPLAPSPFPPGAATLLQQALADAQRDILPSLLLEALPGALAATLPNLLRDALAQTLHPGAQTAEPSAALNPTAAPPPASQPPHPPPQQPPPPLNAAALEAHLTTLVDARLPPLIAHGLDELADAAAQQRATADVELDELVEDARLRLLIARDEAVEELERVRDRVVREVRRAGRSVGRKAGACEGELERLVEEAVWRVEEAGERGVRRVEGVVVGELGGRGRGGGRARSV